MAGIGLGGDPLTGGGISISGDFPLQGLQGTESGDSGAGEIVIEASSVEDAIRRIEELKERVAVISFADTCDLWHGPGASAMGDLSDKTETLRDAAITMLENTMRTLQAAVDDFNATDRHAANGM